MAYIVKAQYGRYIINDESYSSIFVTTGNTIIFDVSHSSNADHPLKISTTKDGTHGVDENGNPGTELDDATAIVNNGVPGDPNAQIMFTPALDGIFYYYCQHHANMGSSITSVQTKFTDLGATAYDAQDGDITNRITKKIYKKDENNVFQLEASIDDSHGNPWEVSNIDITEQASYKIEYNAKGLDDIDASNQPLERYINIITSEPNYQFPAGVNDFVILAKYEYPTWLGNDIYHGPFPQNVKRFTHFVIIGANGSCYYLRSNLYIQYYSQKMIGTWSGGGRDGTQPIIATFVNELPVDGRIVLDDVCPDNEVYPEKLLLNSGEDLADYIGPFGGTETLTFNAPAEGWGAALNATYSSPLSVSGDIISMETNTVDGTLYELDASGSSCDN
ncbi:MAG: hypothetical protein EBR72_06580 [Bacteroidetes bacterium]|nr:hypothetical protein [Bacteroidota bacterium]